MNAAHLFRQELLAAMPRLRRCARALRKPASGPSDPAAAAFRHEREGEPGLFYGVEGQGASATGYALVGSVSREQLLALAEAIYKQGGAATSAK